MGELFEKIGSNWKRQLPDEMGNINCGMGQQFTPIIKKWNNLFS
jgi:hypothetical protein